MSYPGILHHYSPRKVAFEFTPTPRKKVLIFVGGMGDGLLTVPYIPVLVDKLATLNWSLVQIQLDSSFKGWGTSSLADDIEGIRSLVDYLKSEQGGSREKIVLMGHSTGSQDTIHYLLNHGDTIDAGIMQGSVSDRESFALEIDPQAQERLNSEAQQLLSGGRGDELLPAEFARRADKTPITAYRWCSIMVPGGDDDYFSSDLAEETISSTFGKLNKPFLVAYSEADEFVPQSVDKHALLGKWENHSNPKCWSKNSGLIPGASHNVKQKEPQEYLCNMVSEFIKEFDL